MGVSYDVINKAWSFTEDPLLTRKTVSYPAKRYINIKYRNALVNRNQREPRDIEASISTTPGRNETVTETEKYGRNSVQTEYIYKSVEIPLDTSGFPSYRARLNGHLENNLGKALAYSDAVQSAANGFGREQPGIEDQLTTARDNERINRDIIDPHNQDVEKVNSQLPEIEATINRTQGDDYVAQRELLKEYGVAGLEDNFKAFYLTEKLQEWDPKLGAKPLYGDFDSKYYQDNNLEAVQKWNEAVANDDLDITARYGKDGYYLWHYTNIGQQAGARGNAPEATEAATEYYEKPTDKDFEDARTLQLGVDMNTSDARLLSVPYIQEQFEAALNGDPYWKQMAKDNYLSIDTEKPDEFAALFRLSQRDEDKQVAFDFNLNQGYGITELEDAVNQAVGEKATVDVKRFGALTQNVLKDTIAEMKKAKAKEENLDLLRGFGGFAEIMDINKTIANSLINDTGIGGVYALTGGGPSEDDLEEQLEGLTGVRNNVTYNWQQWFDNTLKEKYDEELDLGYTVNEAEANIAIEADFARQFIEDYLQPRFDTSRSMDEFVEYLDVRQEEQNPFQTQDLVNAVNVVADLKSKQYLDQLKNEPGRYFDSEFYFNPTGDAARTDKYLEQANTVAEDWEAAKNGDPYWAQQAYRFGIDVNDKDAFARIHFQVKGQGQGYDAAEDILNASKVSDQIYMNILPALEEEALEQGSVFGQFVTPEEFTEELLQGLDPNNSEEWNEVLERYGLKDFQGNLDELKQYIIETLRTGSAQRIREEIKYLNEKKRKPTQRVLGLTYIERPEDYKTIEAEAETQLYSVFRNAGYEGTEDEFYENMFPDLDRSEQQLLTKAGTGEGLEFAEMDLSDPFASLGTIEGFFGTDEEEESKANVSEERKKELDSFFSLELDPDEEEDYKSDTGKKILGEFTSIFKGF
jgi:hypothetical protein